VFFFSSFLSFPSFVENFPCVVRMYLNVRKMVKKRGKQKAKEKKIFFINFSSLPF